ncbi:MAG: TauD/TfdA family dioxygenase [Pyrinomonadaceae bacterium]
MNITQLGAGSGKLVRCEGERSLLDLDDTAVQDLFKSSGVLLFRNFELDEAAFPAFVARFTSQYLRDEYGNSRVPDPTGGFVQGVTLGSKPIELHSENSVSAERPDLIWFYCTAPALEGGETTFCDGVEVWNRMSDEAKQMFLSKKVKYAVTAPREVYLNREQNVVLRVGRLKFAGTTYRFNDDESLTVEYVVSAVNKIRYGERLAFANGITGPYPSYRTTFEDGSGIPPAVMQEIRQLHQQLTENIPWRAGDLAMIDNSRFLHGRRAFSDKQRRISTMMSLANF